MISASQGRLAAAPLQVRPQLAAPVELAAAVAAPLPVTDRTRA